MRIESISDLLTIKASRRTVLKAGVVAGVTVTAPFLTNLANRAINQSRSVEAQSNTNPQPYTPFGEITYDEKLPAYQVYQDVNSKLDDMSKSLNPLIRETAAKYNELAHEPVPKFILLSDTVTKEPLDVMLATGYENGKDIPVIGVSYRFLLGEAKFGQTLSREDWRVLLYESIEIHNRVRNETTWQDMVKSINELKQNNVILGEAWGKLGSEYGSKVTLPRLEQSWNSFSSPSSLLRN